ncbi:hypothetical protein D3C78_903530 [compost metagenome]
MKTDSMQNWKNSSMKWILATGLAVSAVIPNLYASPASATAATTTKGSIVAETSKELPKVQVIATGGTIA